MNKLFLSNDNTIFVLFSAKNIAFYKINISLKILTKFNKL